MTGNSEPVFHYNLHKKLWNMLSFHAGMDKKEALDLVRKYNQITQEEYEYYLTVENLCVACVYAKEKAKQNNIEDFCTYCPFRIENLKNKDKCLGGKYYTWQVYSRQYLIMKQANDLIKEGKDASHLMLPLPDGKEISAEDIAKNVQRGKQSLKSAYGEAVTKIGVQCMIEASGICCLRLKPKIKID